MVENGSLIQKTRALIKSRELIYSFVLRDLKTRYKGSSLGYLWTILASPRNVDLCSRIFGNRQNKSRKLPDLCIVGNPALDLF